MGCFSFLCNLCGRPIKSDSFRGQRCHLFLLDGGRIIDAMNGEYDSYGRVFDENGESIYWRKPWTEVCDLMFNSNISSGIAAYHEYCMEVVRDIPYLQSEDDPDQGWGEFTLPKVAWKAC